jgi:hypothetical protein
MVLARYSLEAMSGWTYFVKTEGSKYVITEGGGVLDMEATARKLLILYDFRKRMSISKTPPYFLTAVATAHKLAQLVYRLLKHGEAYVVQGMAEYEQIYRVWSSISLVRRRS